MPELMLAPDVAPSFPKCVRLESKPHLFCPGCGHPEVLKAFGFAVDDLDIQRQTAFGVDIGCSLLAFDFFNIDTIATHHRPTAPVMARLNPPNPPPLPPAPLRPPAPPPP